MIQILIATGNSGKYQEITEVLGSLPFRFLSLADLNLTNEVEETGETFEENALLKAKYFFEKTGIPTIGEDSGIEVSALRGELGIKTRRWGAGESATDAEWLEFFLNRMDSESDRSATFFCTAVFYDGEKHQAFCGQTRGTLEKTALCEVPKGIPLSALFIPEGFSQPFAVMTPDQKNSVSHRGKAMITLRNFLKKKISLIITRKVN